MEQEICLILGQVSLNLLCWKKNLQMDTCGPGERLTRRQLTSRPDHLWPKLREKMGKNKKITKKKIIDPEDKEFRKAIKNAPAMSARTTGIFGMVKNPIKSNQNLRVLWKLVM